VHAALIVSIIFPVWDGGSGRKRWCMRALQHGVKGKNTQDGTGRVQRSLIPLLFYY
jgi:hypothetical protein